MNSFDQNEEIKLVDLLKLIVKNVFSIIYFSLVGLVLGLIYVSSMMTPEYTATGTVSMKVSSTTTILNTITEIARSSNVAELALLQLQESNTDLPGLDEISAEEIKAGISASYLSTSLNVTISFSSSNKDTSFQVLNAVLDATVKYANENYTAINNNLMIGDYASDSVYTGQSKTLLLILTTFSGTILGLTIGIFSDLLGGKLLFISDVSRLNIPLYHYVRNRKDTEKHSFEQTINFQNNIESRFRHEPLKFIGFIGTDSEPSIDELLKNMAIQYSQNDLKTIIVDLDMISPTIHNFFGISNEINVSSIVENKYYQKPIYKKISENLFILSSKENIYPSRVLKNPNFEKLITSLGSDFDIVLFKLTPFREDESSLIVLPILDCLVVSIFLNQTSKLHFKSLVRELNSQKFNNKYVFISDYRKSLIDISSFKSLFNKKTDNTKKSV